MGRRFPNILITGTPGTGKSALCAEICNRCPFLKWIDVGKVAKQIGLRDRWDEPMKFPDMDGVVNEELIFLLPFYQVEEALAKPLGGEEGGKVVEYHGGGGSFLPKKWFDYVFVLTTSNTTLKDRLLKRGYQDYQSYHGRKLESITECEIFQTKLEEERKAWPKEIVHALTSDDMETNVGQICNLVQAYTKR